MSELPVKQNLPLKLFLAQDSVRKKMNELLGNRAGKFATALVAIQRGNFQLQKCTPESIMGAAMSAAALNLEIDPNLGEAHLVPYGDSCQLQIGYKGLIQLALRSGQYKRLGAVTVYEGELENFDALEGELKYTPSNRKSDKVIGYAAKFTLINGFERAVFWTYDACHAHGKRFSKSYGRDKSPWVTSPDAMCIKTAIKDLLSHWGPRSIDMRDGLREALAMDTKVFKDADPENALAEGSIDVASEIAPKGDNIDTSHVPAQVQTSTTQTSASGGPEISQSQAELMNVCASCSFDDFVAFWKVQKDLDLSSYSTYAEVPTSICDAILKDARNIGKFVTVYSKKK